MAECQHLFLRTIHLRSAEVWTNGEEAYLLFLFPKSGQGNFVSCAISQKTGPGEVLVVNAAYGGTFSPTDGNDLVFDLFSICQEHLFPLLASHEIAVLHHLISDINRPLWLEATHPVAVEVHKLIAETPSESTLDHRGRLLRISATILSREIKNTRERFGEPLSPRDNLIRALENLPVSDLLSISVEELAQRCNCSRRHLGRLFHQYFKYSVSALKREIRLLKSASLLRNPAAKVINVAQECGFKNHSLFNVYFKRRFGLSPGKWQKATIHADNPARPSFHSPSGCQQLSEGLCPLCNAAKELRVAFGSTLDG